MSDRPIRKPSTASHTQKDHTDKNTVSKGGKIYNALDKLERVARVVAAINRAVMGDPDPKSKKNKKRRRKIKKYAKIDKKRGVLVLKKAKKIKKSKKAKSAKRYK